MIWDYLTTLNVLKVVIIIAIAYIFSKILEIGFIQRLKKRKKERSVIIPINRITSIIIYVAAFIAILSVFNIDITAAAAGLGITAIVIGFGLKDIISNWISGVIIITGNVYRIDDVIRIGRITGVVTDITLRTTRLKTYDRNQVIIPNSKIIEGEIINLTSGRRETISSITFSIDYIYSIEKAKKIIEDVLKKDSNVIFDEEKKREIRFVVRTKEWAVDIEVLFWINDPKNEEFIKSRITETIKKEFERKNILPPLPAFIRERYLKSKK